MLIVAAGRTESYDSSPYLAISAIPIGDVDSIRTVKFHDGRILVGVWGSKPFEILIQSSYPVEPTAVLIASSDGNVYEAHESRLEFICTYLMPYYCLAIAVYPNDNYEALNFFVNGAWKEATFPDESPEMEMPVYPENSEIQAVIEYWWKNEVVKREQEKLKAYEKSSTDNRSSP